MLPGDASQAFTAGDEGTERIKAILFSNPDDVAALLSKFPESGPIKNWGNLRDLVIETRKDDRAKFWTSTLSFQAVRK